MHAAAGLKAELLRVLKSQELVIIVSSNTVQAVNTFHGENSV
jgi:MinD superfamily P-loop ATPase